MLDLVVDRREMKAVIVNALRFMGATPRPVVVESPATVAPTGRPDLNTRVNPSTSAINHQPISHQPF